MNTLMLKKNNGLNLPKGWITCKINDVTKSRRIGIDRARRDQSNSGTPYLKMNNIMLDGSLDLESLVYIKCAESEKKDYCLEYGDVVFNTRNSYELVGKTAFWSGPIQHCVYNNNIMRLRVHDVLLPKFLAYFMNSSQFRKSLLSIKRATTNICAIYDKDLQEQFIPLPPLNEQKRIVAKIEELFSLLDFSKQLLEKTTTLLKFYRQSVLNSSIFGNLTQNWRKQNCVQAVSPTFLTINRRQKWEIAQIKKFESENKIPKNSKWKGKYREPGIPVGEYPKLPEEWIWATLDQITWYVRDGPHYSPKYVDVGIPFITGGNVRPSGVNFDDAKKISPELHEELSKRCKPEQGDILYTKGGTTGIARVNTYDFEFNVWVHVAVLKLIDQIKPFYVQWALNSPFCYSQSQYFTHGVGNQDLGLTRMIKIVLSVPPITEQTAIVELVDKYFSEIDELEKVVSSNLQLIDNLKNAILKQAFEGKLVPQDPNDEPAEILLEKTKQEKQKIISQAPKPRKKK